MLDLLELAGNLPDAKGFLLDLDGTLLLGRDLAPGAKFLLEQVAGRCVVLSNDSEHVPEQLARRFSHHGVQLHPQDFVLAGAEAIDELAAIGAPRRVMIVGSDALLRRARRAGLVVDDRSPEIVLLARDRRFSYAKLASAARAVVDGAQLVLACPDRTHPGPSGEPLPEVGALAAALFACVGAVPHRVIGKPEAHLFERACARLGIATTEAVMIGDNPLTDGVGAARLGIPFFQITPIRAAALSGTSPSLLAAMD